MIYVISPAKTMNFKKQSKIESNQLPMFIKEAEIIMDELKKYAPEDISSLMKISDKLAELNFFRNQAFDDTLNNTKEAIFAFDGEVYKGLNVEEFSREDILYAQEHLRILSGLYGMIKPLDRIKEYRLEMGTKLKISNHKNLYDYWTEKITLGIIEELEQQKGNILINLASEEYSKVINLNKISHSFNVITPIFKDYKSGKYKIISFYAKKARGLMAKYLIENKIDSIEELNKFNLEGYKFSKTESNNSQLIFLRG
ncbi:peroxide stress protein YaaA [Clostridium sp. 'White wine YQ']|uniref:peroxide stress protein YaaA n=1 Tax=Clostridium sp. 'White wine YQ' TaxID=3027474 RepID=UPI0023665DAF|nr:peroxide stress protein YaaA [Clostridium sp. 'White wine YQ']MDD7794539.1 peroxide stress protein YaaA [Clostridium sp. 'White wine YQ']